MPGVKEAPRAVWKWHWEKLRKRNHWSTSGIGTSFSDPGQFHSDLEISIFRCPCRTLSDCRGLWRLEVDTVLTATELLDLLREAGEGCCGGCGKSACEERALA